MNEPADGSEEVRELFREYVPEIATGVVHIRGIARDRGFRSIVSVSTTGAGVDPIHACVGERGFRIKSIVKRLANELVNVVLWSDSAEEHLKNLLSPAAIKRIVFDHARHRADLYASPDQRSLIIGKQGRHLELVSRLTGWRLTVVDE